MSVEQTGAESLLRESSRQEQSHRCVSVEQTGAESLLRECGADRSKSHCCVSVEQTGARVTVA